MSDRLIRADNIDWSKMRFERPTRTLHVEWHQMKYYAHPDEVSDIQYQTVFLYPDTDKGDDEKYVKQIIADTRDVDIRDVFIIRITEAP